MIAAAAPSIAHAGDGDVKDVAPGADVVAEHHADAKGDAKAEGKAEPKKHAKKATHAKKASHGKPSPAAADKGDKGEKAEKAKPSKKTKKTASRGPSKKAAEKKGESKAPPIGARGSATGKPCFGPPVTIDRGGLEAETFSLVTCAGSPVEASRARLSALARPWGSPKPDTSAKARHGHGRGSAAPPVHLLDRGLATRLDAIARHFPGHAISVVSGYRPKSRGSLHQSGRAIDVRVAGVTNAELWGFCRTLVDTGCGYYPNSSFVHVDVRTKGTGMVTWIDASGPGEAPRYVSEWPPREDATAPAVAAGDEEHDSTATPDDATYEDDGDTTTPHVPAKAPPAGGVLPGLAANPVAPSLVR